MDQLCYLLGVSFWKFVHRHNKYINEISNKIELMKLNLDNDYKVMELDCGQYESIYNEYERVWESYHVRNFLSIAM